MVRSHRAPYTQRTFTEFLKIVSTRTNPETQLLSRVTGGSSEVVIEKEFLAEGCLF